MDWLPHNGVAIPVEMDVCVRVRMRDGFVNEGRAGDFFGWRHRGPADPVGAYDIVDYTPLPPAPAPDKEG